VALGAELVLTPDEDGIAGEVERVREMAAGAAEVVKSVEQISAISEENAAAAQEVSAAAQEQNASVEEMSASAQQMSSLAVDLQALVAQFKLGNGETRATGRHAPAERPKAAAAA